MECPQNEQDGKDDGAPDSTSKKRNGHRNEEEASAKKARPKRNRKRPRSSVLNEETVIETIVRPLCLPMLSVPKDDITSSAETVNLQEITQEEGIVVTLDRSNSPANGIMTSLPDNKLVRIVKPYPYTFTSYCKERWIGRTILDVYCTEFGSYPQSYYENAIRQGHILVSDTTVGCSYLLKGSDVLQHTVHRHEPAIAVYSKLSPYFYIVGENNDVVAIDKPCTVPIHPCGGYHKNSLMNILEEESVYGKLYTIHRLDRLTSGLVVLAKTPTAAKVWGQAIQQRDCQKIYLARVKGRFCGVRRTQDEDDSNETSNSHIGSNGDRKLDGVIPLLQHPFPQYGESENADDVKTKVPIRSRHAHGYWFSDSTGNNPYSTMSLDEFATSSHTVDEWINSIDSDTTAMSDPQSGSTRTTGAHENKSLTWLHLVCPVRIEQPKIGVCAAGLFTDLDAPAYQKTVKPAHTAFGVVNYFKDDDSTLIIVRPVTGRTHQIRIHLQYLGHSIVNDPNYGGSLWHGNPEGELACTVAQQILSENSHTNASSNEHLVTSDVPATDAEVDQIIHNPDIRRGEHEATSDFIRRSCVWCARNHGRNVEERAMLEFMVRSPGLWLHALQYKVKSVCFRTALPAWGQC